MLPLLFFERLTNVLLKEIEEQKTGLRELTARFDSSQKELKTTREELKLTHNEIKN